MDDVMLLKVDAFRRRRRLCVVCPFLDPAPNSRALPPRGAF